MMGLRDIGATLPPGFRFYPSDEELVCHYLYKKVADGEVSKDSSLVEIDLHTCEPWQLPDVAKLNATEWYFFSFRDRKYATGYRTNRATTTGYWKATGKDRTVIDPKTRSMVGMRKTLVFYKNRAPNGIKTGWIMHEFRLENPNIPPKEDWVLCRVFHKSKTENGGDQNDVCENMINSNIRGGTATSPPVGGPAPIYNSQISCYTPAAVHHQSHPYSAMLAQLDRNYLQLSHDIINGGGDGRISHYKSEAEEEDCGGAFFFDGINAPISNTLEEMQFDDDSSLVFI